MCTFLLQNVALWDMTQMHSGICEMGLLKLHYYITNREIVRVQTGAIPSTLLAHINEEKYVFQEHINYISQYL